MSDFHQSGTITTLHALYDIRNSGAYLVNLEKRLEEHASRRRICLLLPSLFSELQNTHVMDRIMDEIRQVHYLHKIVIALGGTTDEQEFQQAKDYFGQLRTENRDVKVVWVEGPRIQYILQNIRDKAITTGIQGKGQSVWIALGYIFATNDTDVIGLHDCDIATYSRILLGRLLEPTANPNNDFQCCKGYYARISPTEQMMKGRVTRVFVFPFVDAMTRVVNERGLQELEDFFRYHASFKYPLSGEFSFTTHLARSINIAYDWGLEVATLSQVYDQVIPRKIAQIDLAPNYEHKHQELSPEDADKGLHRRVIDIAKFYPTFMRSRGVPLNDSFVDMMIHTYYQNALKFLVINLKTPYTVINLKTPCKIRKMKKGD
jgi:glucosyl-3-phosphoglycerate synthase